LAWLAGGFRCTKIQNAKITQNARRNSSKHQPTTQTTQHLTTHHRQSRAQINITTCFAGKVQAPELVKEASQLGKLVQTQSQKQQCSCCVPETTQRSTPSPVVEFTTLEAVKTRQRDVFHPMLKSSQSVLKHSHRLQRGKCTDVQLHQQAHPMGSRDKGQLPIIGMTSRAMQERMTAPMIIFGLTDATITTTHMRRAIVTMPTTKIDAWNTAVADIRQRAVVLIRTADHLAVNLYLSNNKSSTRRQRR
jgi:hypothetical protein